MRTRQTCEEHKCAACWSNVLQSGGPCCRRVVRLCTSLNRRLCVQGWRLQPPWVDKDHTCVHFRKRRILAVHSPAEKKHNCLFDRDGHILLLCGGCGWGNGAVVHQWEVQELTGSPDAGPYVSSDVSMWWRYKCSPPTPLMVHVSQSGLLSNFIYFLVIISQTRYVRCWWKNAQFFVKLVFSPLSSSKCNIVGPLQKSLIIGDVPFSLLMLSEKNVTFTL